MNEQLGYPYRTTRYEAIVKRATAQQPAATQRAGHYAGLHPEDTPYITGQLQAQEEELEEDDSYYTPRTVPSSARRYQMVPDGHVIQQGNKRIVVHYGAPPIKHRRHTQEPQPPQAPVRKHIHWLVFVGIGMFLMVVSWIGVNALGTWWQTTQDTLHYGMPRTFQIDQVVGHGDSPIHPSHFIVINLNRHIEIIELPGGDTSKARMYNGPTLLGTGQELEPVTISFQDLTGNGKPDMLIHVSDQIMVMINENGQFRPAKPGEVHL